MDPSGGRDSRYNLGYGMGMMTETGEIYGNPNVSLARPPSGMGQLMGRGGGLLGSQNSQCGPGGGGGGNNISSRGLKRTNSDCYDHERGGMGINTNLSVLENCGSSGGAGSVVSSGGGSGGMTDVNVDDSYTALTQQNKKSPPSNGKKTKGRVKIKMEYIDNKLRRYTTFSKRKTGIMKKAYELSTLTGTQVMLLVASETGHVYTFATRKLQPMITSEAGKALIQTCLNSPDPPTGVATGDQRMSATGFEETELSYNIADEDSKDDRSPMSSGDSDSDSGPDSPGPSLLNHPSSSSSGNIPIEAHLSSNPTTISQQDFKATNLSNVVYPSALGNLPQDVLLGLVQTGHLQFHTDEDGSHQYITIPLSMTPGALSAASNKQNAKDTNGRESPPNQEITIKKECGE